MDSQQRQVFFELDQVPSGTKILSIEVKVPRVFLATDTYQEPEALMFDWNTVYVEISYDEWLNAKDNPEQANALAHQFGELVRQQLGASWYRWHDAAPEA